MARRRNANEDEIKLVQEDSDREESPETNSGIRITVSDVDEDSSGSSTTGTPSRIEEEYHVTPLHLTIRQKLCSRKYKRRCWWLTVAILGTLCILAVSVPLGLWSSRPKEQCRDFEDAPAEEYEEYPFLYFAESGQLDFCQRGETKLEATLGINHDYVARQKVDYYLYSSEAILNITRKDVNCLRIEWDGISTEGTPLKDCYKLGDANWYGAYELYNQQWTFNESFGESMDMNPFLPHDYLSDNNRNAFGPVLHPLWLTSTGVGILVDKDVELHVTIDNEYDTRDDYRRELCIQALPFEVECNPRSSSKIPLHYTLCIFDTIAETAQNFLENYIQHPTGTPSPEVFREPIWSTWAEYKTEIDESKLEDFYKSIRDHNFPISQLEIDDGYSAEYGDLSFDDNKFPNGLNDLASQVNLTAWVHPFVNIPATDFSKALGGHYFLPGYAGHSVSLVRWWHDYGAVINYVDAATADWQWNRLETFRTQYGLVSFKFDAGEVTYLPKCVYIENVTHPVMFAEAYARFVGALSDSVSSRAEVRVGYFTQDLPIFVRMLDRNSTWELSYHGLQSVVTAALSFGIAGYSFVLPDMIGGNDSPDSRLFMRWVQLNAFLPVMQFSVVPWRYNDDEVVDCAWRMVELHGRLHDEVFESLTNESIEHGYPIIRPIWWLVSTNDNVPPGDPVFTINDQFLIGENIMAAPILTERTDRLVYFPPGTSWLAEMPAIYNDGTQFEGGATHNFTVPLTDTLYFRRSQSLVPPSPVP